MVQKTLTREKDGIEQESSGGRRCGEKTGGKTSELWTLFFVGGSFVTIDKSLTFSALCPVSPAEV